MARILFLVLTTTALFLGTSALAVAQQPASSPSAPDTAKPSLIGEALASYDRTKKNIIAAAEVMPAQNFSFKPTPAIRSYAELFNHAAQAQTGLCSVVSGAPSEHQPASTAATKDQVIAVLKKSLKENMARQ